MPDGGGIEWRHNAAAEHEFKFLHKYEEFYQDLLKARGLEEPSITVGYIKKPLKGK